MNSYTIIYVSDRAMENMNRIRRILKDWRELSDNEAVHGMKTNAFKKLYEMGFWFDYRPDDGRTSPMMPTEAGLFASHILAITNALDKGCEQFVLFEDDAIISDDFEDIYTAAVKDAPNGWDFISMIVEPARNHFSDSSDIGSDFIHRCLTQPSCTGCIVYSRNGIQNYIRHIKESGIYYNIDSMLYRASHAGKLNGYILRNEYAYAVTHEPDLLPSEIDPLDKRGTSPLSN